MRLIRANTNILMQYTKLWKLNTALNVIANKQKLVFKGQGDGDTKWKGWAWNKLLVELVKCKNILATLVMYY